MSQQNTSRNASSAKFLRALSAAGSRGKPALYFTWITSPDPSRPASVRGVLVTEALWMFALAAALWIPWDIRSDRKKKSELTSGGHGEWMFGFAR